MGRHPSFQLGWRGIRQRIGAGLGVSRLVRSSKGGWIGCVVERVLGIALVGLLRHAVAFHVDSGQEGDEKRRAAGASHGRDCDVWNSVTVVHVGMEATIQVTGAASFGYGWKGLGHLSGT